MTCVITQSGTLGSNAVFAAEFSGFSASATLDQMATAASSSSTTMNELDFNNTLANDAMFVASLTNNVQASASTVNSPFTGAFFSPTGGNYNYLIAYGAEASSGLYKFTGTWNSGSATMQWAAGLYCICWCNHQRKRGRSRRNSFVHRNCERFRNCGRFRKLLHHELVEWFLHHHAVIDRLYVLANQRKLKR